MPQTSAGKIILKLFLFLTFNRASSAELENVVFVHVLILYILVPERRLTYVLTSDRATNKRRSGALSHEAF